MNQANKIWGWVHEERAALIEDLAALTPDQWETPSLCGGWSVHDVAAHLVDSARSTKRGFAVEILRARFDFHRLNQRGVDRERGADPGITLDRLREVARRTSTPPAPLASRLLEEIVHGEDIRRPLGVARGYPDEAVERALHLQARTSASFGGGKDLVDRVRLVADDTGLDLGSGPTLHGPMLSLLLLLSRRPIALEDLAGAGLDRAQAQLAVNS